MIKKQLSLALLVIVLAAGTIGYAVSQLLVQKTLTASVSVSASAGLSLTDTDGNPLTTLSYGIIPVNKWVNQTIVVHNSGNVPLSLTCSRVDTSTGISINFANVDGTWFAPSVGKPLGVGESIEVVIQVRAGGDALGDYTLEFSFTGN